MAHLKNIINTYRFPILSLAVCVIAYGLQIPWLGFYWDDWPLAWFSRQFGPAYFIGYAPFRPASGWLYAISFSVLRESPLAWQLFGLFWRWAGVLAFWWLLRLLWRRANHLPELAALIFAVYPGFRQQPIAVNYSLYWMYYTFFLCSLSLMVLALRNKTKRMWFTLGAIALSLLMLSTEYFYGLELLRPLVLWMALDESGIRGKQRMRAALRAWLPYVPLVIAVFIWRFSVAEPVESGGLYSTPLAYNLAAHPIGTLSTLVGTMLGDFFEAGIAAWGNLAIVWNQLNFFSRVVWIYGLVVAAGGLLVWLTLSDKQSKVPNVREGLILGGAALLVGGLPFWVAQLPLRLNFAWDRLTLPMIFGVALVFGSIIEGIRMPWKYRVIFLSAILGLAAGMHFMNANEYRLEWQGVRKFFTQLAWRAPSLEPNTALLGADLGFEHNTDSSLTAPLNWFYQRGPIGEELPYYLGYLGAREGVQMEGGTITVSKKYGPTEFNASNGEVLIFYYAPPSCLRILDPEIDFYLPRLPQTVTDWVEQTNLNRILQQPDLATEPGFPFWSTDSEESWCYYFEKADLARQEGNWLQVATLGEQALSFKDWRDHVGELTPFIEGYAHVDNWDQALKLTQDELTNNPRTRRMLCALWQRIGERTAASAKRTETLDQIQSLLGCSSL